MYSFDEVRQALESGSLSEGLFRLGQFARAHENEELARWAEIELSGEGWEGGKEAPLYRQIASYWITSQGQIVHSKDGSVEYDNLPLWLGVQQLEQFVEAGLAEFRRGVAVSGVAVGRKVEGSTISGILNAIRNLAREKLENAFPPNPAIQTTPSGLMYASPDFTKLVKEPKSAAILESRWIEANKVFQAGAYLATIVMLGSIWEGVLWDKVYTDLPQVNRAPSAPKDRQTQSTLPFEKWTFSDLIQVTYECGWVSKGIRDLSDSLREYRNYIHVRKQMEQDAYYPEVGLCTAAWGVVLGSFQDLSR